MGIGIHRATATGEAGSEAVDLAAAIRCVVFAMACLSGDPKDGRALASCARRGSGRASIDSYASEQRRRPFRTPTAANGEPAKRLTPSEVSTSEEAKELMVPFPDERKSHPPLRRLCSPQDILSLRRSNLRLER